MEYIAVFFGVLTFAAFSWRGSHGTCTVPTNLLNPPSLRGNIVYSSILRHEDCTWTLPEVGSDSHVLFLYVEDIRMTYIEMTVTGCSGKLLLPEMDPICKVPKRRCLLYSASKSCNFGKIVSSMTNTSSNCTSTVWHNVREIPRKISVKAMHQDAKNFSVRYEMIKCNVINESFVTSKKQILDGKVDKPTSSPTSSTSTAPYIAAIVTLCILLLLALFCVLYSRRKGLQNPAKKTRETEYSAGVDVQRTNQVPQPSFGDGANMQTNEYEEIEAGRFRSGSRELVTNAIY